MCDASICEAALSPVIIVRGRTPVDYGRVVWYGYTTSTDLIPNGAGKMVLQVFCFPATALHKGLKTARAQDTSLRIDKPTFIHCFLSYHWLFLRGDSAFSITIQTPQWGLQKL